MCLLSLVQRDDQMARALVNRIGLAAVLRLETLDDRTRIGPGLGDIQRVARRRGFIFVRVGDGRANDLLDHSAGALLAEAKHREGVVHASSADEIHQSPRLAWRDASESVFGLKRHWKPQL